MAKDASDVKPYFVDDDNLRPRDNSGGPDYRPHSGDWGDGGKTVGDGLDSGLKGAKGLSRKKVGAAGGGDYE